jgi:RNA polymerase sigma factor (sigma-70 family)
LNNPYSIEEQELVRRCLRRDDRAQMRLYRKYVQAMYNTVVRMVANKMDAEDIIQEVFVKVFQKLSEFRGESTLGAWIKRITVNTTLNFIRQRKEIKFMENEEWDRSDLLQEEKKIDPEFSMKQVHHAIKKLPDGCRVVLNLYLLEGYQHQEIASILKITESTSKTQYRRGKQLLAKKLRMQR